MKRYYKYYLISLFVIALDQGVKLLVYYNMDMGTIGQIPILGDFFKLHYLLNPGMAFGMKIDLVYGKLILTTFRLIAMFVIAYYLYTMIKKNAHSLYSACIAMILGGAIGNLIDSVFYGVWFDNAPYNAPYDWFNGQVIDMFYIDIWQGRVSEAIPIFGGKYLSLWPVFNVADASIFCSVIIILVFQKKFFPNESSE